MNIQAVTKNAFSLLENAEISSARLDAELIVSEVIHKSRAWALAHPGYLISPENQRQISSAVKRRQNHEPLAYIFGKTEFYGFMLYVDKNVLVPRPESETIVEWVVQNSAQNCTLLDVGAGSGALAIAVKKNRPDLLVCASDISPVALNVAARNADSLDVDIHFTQSDLLESIDIQPEIIVANLPYVPSASELNKTAAHEPELALLAGKNGLEYYLDLFKQLTDSRFDLTKTVVIEANPDQFNPLYAQLDSGWSLETISDYVGVFKKLTAI